MLCVMAFELLISVHEENTIFTYFIKVIPILSVCTLFLFYECERERETYRAKLIIEQVRNHETIFCVFLYLFGCESMH